MTSRAPEVGLDSNCLSYVIDAIAGQVQPNGDLEAECVALVRIYLYGIDDTLWITPTVRTELEAIRDAQRRTLHASWASTIFGVFPLNDLDRVEVRAARLAQFHDANDARIVAEAEDIGLRVLLTRDRDLVTNLGDHTAVHLRMPSEYWAELSIPVGAEPRRVPAKENPLAAQSWWR